MKLEINDKILPKNLFQDGFGVKGEVIDVSKLKDICSFIDSNFFKKKTINESSTSYGLKNIIERKIGCCISNGSFIASMILNGFNYKIKGKNAVFNITKKSVKNLKIT